MVYRASGFQGFLGGYDKDTIRALGIDQEFMELGLVGTIGFGFESFGTTMHALDPKTLNLELCTLGPEP